MSTVLDPTGAPRPNTTPRRPGAGGDRGPGPTVPEHPGSTGRRRGDPITTAVPAVERLLPHPASRAFLRWALAIDAVVSAGVLAACLRTSDGKLVYVLDDPAIHLEIARNVVEHGTWGVVPGQFESASSSPLWTSLLSAGVAVLPAGEEALALVLNLVFGAVVLTLVARAQTVLRPSRRRPLDVVATAVVVVAVLFVPAMAMVGMEHMLHLALLLVAVPLVLRRGRAPSWGRQVLPYGLFALATLTRLETAFVALGLGVAIAADVLPWGRDAPRPWRPAAARIAGLGLASGLPLLAYGLVNKAMGQDWLPNSVAAKSESLNGNDRIPEPREVMERLTMDPLLTVLVGACLVLAVVGWQRRERWATLGLAVAVAAGAHVTLAQVGWYERYQMYLIGLAVVALAWAARDLPRPPVERRPHLVPLLVLVLLLTTTTKVALTVDAPRGVADTYQQRYQAARFLERYYDGQPIGTGELGYISLYHDGPITDFYGLADHEVLQARRTIHDHDARIAFWDELVQRRGVRVAALYPTNLLFEIPDRWILVGTWTLDREPFTAYDAIFQFYALQPEEVAPLQEHLDEFSATLPGGVTYTRNDGAGLQAIAQMVERDGGG